VAGRGWFVWLHWRGFGIRSDRGFGDRNFKLSEGDPPEFLKFQPKPRDERQKHAADKQTAPAPTHAKIGTSGLCPGYADAVAVTSPETKMAVCGGRKPFCLLVSSLITNFIDFDCSTYVEQNIINKNYLIFNFVHFKLTFNMR